MLRWFLNVHTSFPHLRPSKEGLVTPSLLSENVQWPDIIACGLATVARALRVTSDTVDMASKSATTSCPTAAAAHCASSESLLHDRKWQLPLSVQPQTAR